MLVALLLQLAAAPALPRASAAPAADRVVGARTFAWLDADGDERLDLFLVDTAGRPRLLLQRADATLEDVTAASGLAVSTPVRSFAWLDVEGDGLADVLLVHADGACALFVGEGGACWRRAPLGPSAEGPRAEK